MTVGIDYTTSLTMLTARVAARALRQTGYGFIQCRHSTKQSLNSSVDHGERVEFPELPNPQLDYARLIADFDTTTRNAALRNMNTNADVEELQSLHLKAQATDEVLVEAKGELGTWSSAHRDQKRKRAKKDARKKYSELKDRVRALSAERENIERQMLDLAFALPNWSHPEAPVGPEPNAVEVERFGPEPIPAQEERDHVDIARKFGWMDTASSALATGSSWPFLIGAFGQLELALVGYALSVACKHGYTPVSPPDVVNTDVARRCGFQPRDGPDGPKQTYFLEAEEGHYKLCLSGTAEISLAAMLADKTMYLAALPAKVVGVGRAYRAEAGARGQDTRGLYRVHEFTKVELFNVSPEQESDKQLEEMRAIQKEVAESLGLSVRLVHDRVHRCVFIADGRVLNMPTEELGASAARKYDMEAWMPGRGKWGEISSASNCTDYQSRRLNIKYRDTVEDKVKFAHTLNGTAAAIPRLIVALVENGAVIENEVVVRVELPKALERFWVGGDCEGLIRFV